MGAIEMLRLAFTAAKDGTHSGPDAAVLRSVMQGGRKVAIAADSFPELVAALDLAKEFGFEPVLVGARDAEKVLPRLAQQKASVVLDPLGFDQRQARLQLPTRLAEAGVPFCFGGNAQGLRMSAVLAVRNGLDRKTALAALTRTPAMLFDQSTLVGSLRQGCAGDFAVFTGDPLDLTSAHVATWIGGVRACGTEPNAKKANPAAASKAAGNCEAGSLAFAAKAEKVDGNVGLFRKEVVLSEERAIRAAYVQLQLRACSCPLALHRYRQAILLVDFAQISANA
jgi:hypothetical protein